MEHEYRFIASLSPDYRQLLRIAAADLVWDKDYGEIVITPHNRHFRQALAETLPSLNPARPWRIA